MGIPQFSSRMRSHGSTNVIGCKGEQRRDRAIIDGPSLAHALLQAGEVGRGDEGLLPRCSYTALGKAVIDWLKSLEEHGFVVDAIYFDGALPEHKQTTRIGRLQAYVDKLAVFKAVSDDLAKATRNSRSGPGPQQVRHHLERAQCSLPPPPFLVFAVVEALRESFYAERTFVVHGEADEFCAAKAMDMPPDAYRAITSIFTNDSDLIVYGFDNRVRVVQINEMVRDDDERGRPSHLRSLENGESIQDLVRPAYLMKLDPHLSFRNALADSRRNKATFLTSEYNAFAVTYNLTNPHAILSKEATNNCISHRSLDSRVSEILLKALQERERIQETEFWYATEDARVQQQRNSDLARGWTRPRDSGKSGPDAAGYDNRLVKGNDTIDGVSFRDFAVNQKAQDLKPSDLNLFLPVLFEDISRATAWKAGSVLRGVAMHVATTLCGISATVNEYKRSGRRVREAVCQQIPRELCIQRLETWTNDWLSELKKLSMARDSWKWRIVVVKLLLADMAREEMTLPTRDALRELLTNQPAETWDAVHLHAQYQAEYYSLRVLKQVLGFVSYANDKNEPATTEALQALETLPSIAGFCDPVTSECDDAWRTALDRFLDEWCVSGRSTNTEPAATEPELPATTRQAKRSGSARKKRKTTKQMQNAFSSLGDAEEA